MELDPGTVVANRYRITRPLGRGGMGEVFAAENLRTGRPVAIKLLRDESRQKSSAVARFRQEARAAGSINSDHVTQVLDVEEDAAHGIVLVFELLEGESLIDRLKRTGPVAFDELHPIVEQVLMGLADAHKVGIVHRDLKPSNVFLERRPDGSTRVKILDFGISKLPKEMGGETLTEMGQSLGTFSFMPPEQIGKAKTVDHRADIYACATLIYQALSGQLPYLAKNVLVMVELKNKAEPRTLAEAMGEPVDPRLEAFLAKGLARDPARRFATAQEALVAWRELKARPQPALGPVSQTLPYAAHDPRSSVPLAAPTSASGLPVLNEVTNDGDNVATIAMPLHKLSTGATVTTRGGTSVMDNPHTPGVGARPRSERHAAAAQSAPASPRASAPASAYAPSSSDGLPRLYDESTSNAPQSDVKTIVFRPQAPSSPGSASASGAYPAAPRPAAGMPAQAPMPQPAPPPPNPMLASSPGMPMPAPAPKPRSAALLVLGALVLALVGFGIVAIAIELSRGGHLF